MSTVFKKTSEMTTILKVVICSLFVFFLSCSKYEEEQKQTPIVPNINEAQAVIGGENIFENYVNIEDFKNMKVEDDITYQKHQKAQEKLLSYNFFPKANNYKKELSKISSFLKDKSNLYQYSHDAIFNSLSHSKYVDFNFKKFVEPAVEIWYYIFYDQETESTKIRVLTPKEAKDIIPVGKRYDLPDYHNFLSINKITYYLATGIPKEDFKDLRVISTPIFKKDAGIYERNRYVYQMPYNDNYLDYQNDTAIICCNSTYILKSHIKPGSLIFIFDRPLEDLYKYINWKEFFQIGNNDWGVKNWGHMMIVGKWYTDKINQYNKLSDYKILKENEDFYDIPFLNKRCFHSQYIFDISFTDYLKHFVFIEAQNGKQNNKNKLQGFDYDEGVMLTAGNDERFQNYIKNATCIAVVNLNDGYNYSHPNLVDNMINFAYRQLGKPYNWHPNILETESYAYNCSGLVYYSFLNNYNFPSLKLVLTKHAAGLTSLSDWIMPRTVCNSPFVYTRVWYKK